jgi:hypothetical protein
VLQIGRIVQQLKEAPHTFASFLDHILSSWASKKQLIVSLSSAEAEYRALATTSIELTWLQYLLHDIGLKLEHHPLIL